jgi:outer membrane protein assembly factor BamB
VGAKSKLFAVRDNGASASKKWEFTAGAGIATQIAIGADGTIYVKEYGNNLYAVQDNGASGSQKWVITLGGNISGKSSPAIGPDGTIYVGANDNNLYAITDNGASATQKWAFTAEGSLLNSSPAIGADGIIYVGGSGLNHNKVYALQDDVTQGTQKWAFDTDYYTMACPAVGADGIVYAVSNGGTVYAINPGDGSEKWHCSVFGSDVDSGPAIVADGTIYASFSAGEASGLHAIYGDSPGLAATHWPKFHHDLNNTGSVKGSVKPVAIITPIINLLLGN